MNDLVACLNPEGLMVLSGILTILRDDVEEAAARVGLKIVERGEAGEWSLLLAQRGEA